MPCAARAPTAVQATRKLQRLPSSRKGAVALLLSFIVVGEDGRRCDQSAAGRNNLCLLGTPAAAGMLRTSWSGACLSGKPAGRLDKLGHVYSPASNRRAFVVGGTLRVTGGWVDV